jgi:hypothetical protein
MTGPAAGPRSNVRLGLALLAVLLYAGVSSGRWLRRPAEGRPRAGLDEISLYERRFAALRPALPARGRVGYLGDPDPAGPPPAEGESAALLHFRRYLLAQYSLAPLLLVESTDPEFVIGNFDPGAPRAAPPGFRQVGTYADGLVLFRREGP